MTDINISSVPVDPARADAAAGEAGTAEARGRAPEVKRT